MLPHEHTSVPGSELVGLLVPVELFARQGLALLAVAEAQAHDAHKRKNAEDGWH